MPRSKEAERVGPRDDVRAIELRPGLAFEVLGVGGCVGVRRAKVIKGTRGVDRLGRKRDAELLKDGGMFWLHGSFCG